MLKTFKEKIREKLIADFRGFFVQEHVEPAALQEVITRALEEVANKEKHSVPDADKAKVLSELMNEFTGYGPIDSLIKDPHITEIMINGPKNIYVERDGRTELSTIVFDDDKQVMALVYKILAPTRRRVDESYPFCDVSLKDGSRVNIIVPPLALDGPVITIRKFSREIRKIEDLIQLGTMDNRMADFLIAAIKTKLNIIFSGATGAGKTTTLNVLSGYIADKERIVTIEDTAELRLNQDHVVRLEAKQANIEGKGEITIRDLFKNTLRMRPDRILLGEIRGSEALEMLQAMCSGHKGSLAVIHADSPQEVINRLETVILTSGVPINIDVIHRQITTSVHLIVHQEQLMDGTRRITRISQINGLKNNEVVVEDIFFYEIEGIDPTTGAIKGNWKASGIVPLCYQKFKRFGIVLSKDIFR